MWWLANAGVEAGVLERTPRSGAS